MMRKQQMTMKTLGKKEKSRKIWWLKKLLLVSEESCMFSRIY